mmetsp:Transcript_24865/g.72867  ORF Transcript_24865/g.72867 Transcript_24865/m.72867 type:complete len:129 (-) Transcript_24865:47-433(-)
MQATFVSIMSTKRRDFTCRTVSLILCNVLRVQAALHVSRERWSHCTRRPNPIFSYKLGAAVQHLSVAAEFVPLRYLLTQIFVVDAVTGSFEVVIISPFSPNPLFSVDNGNKREATVRRLRTPCHPSSA